MIFWFITRTGKHYRPNIMTAWAMVLLYLHLCTGVYLCTRHHNSHFASPGMLPSWAGEVCCCPLRTDGSRASAAGAAATSIARIAQARFSRSSTRWSPSACVHHFRAKSVSIVSSVRQVLETRATSCGCKRPGRSIRRSRLVLARRLNALDGVSCVDSPGALYLFPKLELPAKAIEAAQKAGKAPDAFYCVALLDETGICTVPGSGFGQKDGEAHYRLTCLCDGVDEYVGKLERFHRSFMQKYA